MDAIKQFYIEYIDCLNNRKLSELHKFVAKDVAYNSKSINLDSFRQMLEQDVEEIPDLYYKIEALDTGLNFIAAKLHFDCTPKRTFKGIAVNGKKVSFNEDVTYELEAGKIKRIYSEIDTAAIKSQVSEQDV